MYGCGLFMKGEKRCSPTQIVWLWNREVSTQPHMHKCAHTHRALRALVMTVPIAGFVELPNPSVLCEWLSSSKAEIHAHTWPSRECKNEGGPWKSFNVSVPPFVHRAGAEENSRMGWCDMPRVSMPGGGRGRTNNTEICSKYIISISTRGETLLLGDPLIGEM